MQGEPKVIEHLNNVLKIELTVINQYFLHARMFKNWGLEGLNEKDYHKSIENMKHADKIMERILFLDGLPNLQDLGRLFIGEAPKEMIELDLRQTMENMLPALREAIAYCESVKDYVSRDLLEDLMEEEEEFVDWLEAQLWLIEKTGIENYLQTQMNESD